jgi:hypothetical protein
VKAGDRVVTTTHDPAHHTRIPKYARGHRGEIVRDLGPAVLPDENAQGRSDLTQEHVYQVRFAAKDLWGEGDHHVTVDLWASYLRKEPT